MLFRINTLKFAVEVEAGGVAVKAGPLFFAAHSADGPFPKEWGKLGLDYRKEEGSKTTVHGFILFRRRREIEYGKVELNDWVGMYYI